MSILGLFRKSKVGGDIAMLGLEDWWQSTFSRADREWMAGTYAPMGGRPRPLDEGPPYRPAPHPFRFLSGVAPWFSKEGYQHCAIAFLEKSMEFCTEDLPVLDRHFALGDYCRVFYRWRDAVPGALENAVAACELCISFHKEAASALRSEFGWVPAHACFNQLRIIEEKRANWMRAIELCEQAKAGEWTGDWDKAIARIEKKITKAARRGGS